MAAHTVAEVQTALNNLGFGPITVDGAAGPETDAAVTKFQTAKFGSGASVTGSLDDTTLSALFPSRTFESKPRTIQATIADYALNFVKSKTVYAAGALVALAVTWINTRFGFKVPPDVQNTVTALLISGFGLLIGVLQTAFNSPHMTTKQPAVVQKPGEFK